MNKSSFENVQKWCEELRYYAESDLILLIVGNKKDKEKERQIKTRKGEELAKQLEAEYLETSIKDFDSIKKVFELLAEKVYENRKIYQRMHLEKMKIVEAPIEIHQKCRC